MGIMAYTLLMRTILSWIYHHVKLTRKALGYENVHFVEEEFNEYFTKFCTKKLKRLKNEDIPFLYEYVYITTSLHPGLVVFTMDEIFKRFNRRTSEHLTFGKVFAFL